MTRENVGMHDTPARLLKLLSLLQAPREWPGSELASRLEVTPRTVRRDVDRLRELALATAPALGPDRALVDPEQLTALAAAITAGERVRFSYGPTGVRRL